MRGVTVGKGIDLALEDGDKVVVSRSASAGSAAVLRRRPENGIVEEG